MLAAVKRFLVHRTVVVVLLALVALLLAGGSRLPERPFSLDPGGLDHYLSADGVHHLVTTHGAALLVALCLASLLVACWDMLRTAWARTFRTAVPPEWRAFPGASDAEVARVARAAGFRPLRARGPARRFVRHPWGHWANLLLHGGMALSLVAFQLYAATDHHSALSLIEGEAVAQGADAGVALRGPLAPDRELPVGIRLDAVRWESDERGLIEDVDAHLVLRDGERERASTISPNDAHYGWGYRVYQGGSGHAFFVDVAHRGGASRHALALPLPASAGAAAYGDFRLPELPGLLRAKYRVDGGFPDGEVELTLRLVRDDAIAGQVALRRGDSGALADAAVTLVEVRRWSGLLVDAGRGMTVVFLGFVLVVLGAGLLYAASPAELVVVPAVGGGLSVGARTFGRRDRAGAEALERIVARLARGEGA